MEIVISDIGVDFLYQFADAAKGAAPNCLLGDEPEPALHLVEPTCVSGGVVEVIAGVAGEPGLDLGMLVGAVKLLAIYGPRVLGRDVAVEVIKKGNKFLVAMARFAHGHHFAVEHVERREQGGGAVTKIIMGYALDITQTQRQQRLGPLQRLHLALFVDTQHQRLVRRIEVKAHDVAYLLHKKWVGRELKAPAAMGLYAEQCEIPCHCALGDAGGDGGRAHAPVRGVLGLASTTSLINCATFSSSCVRGWPAAIRPAAPPARGPDSVGANG